MKLQGLVDVLEYVTGIRFTEWTWSSAPNKRYGVVTMDGQTELKADSDPVAETMPTGYVDVFIQAKDPDPTKKVETALKIIGVWFSLESIQYENDTGLIHFEWRWVDTLRKAEKTMYISPVFVKMYDTVDVAALVEAAQGGAYLIGVYPAENVTIYSTEVALTPGQPQGEIEFTFVHMSPDTPTQTIRLVRIKSDNTFNETEIVEARCGSIMFDANIGITYEQIQEATTNGQAVFYIDQGADPIGTVNGTLVKRLVWYGHDETGYYATFGDVGFYAVSSDATMREY